MRYLIEDKAEGLAGYGGTKSAVGRDEISRIYPSSKGERHLPDATEADPLPRGLVTNE